MPERWWDDTEYATGCPEMSDEPGKCACGMELKKCEMAKAEHKSFAAADEAREFPKGRLELIKIGGATVGRAVFEPGWRWSTSVQPSAKTKSCEAPHFQYHVSGVLRVVMDDGTELDCKAGDVSLLPSGHDAWVVGDEPVVVVDFQGMLDYARAR